MYQRGVVLGRLGASLETPLAASFRAVCPQLHAFRALGAELQAAGTLLEWTSSTSFRTGGPLHTTSWALCTDDALRLGLLPRETTYVSYPY